MYRMKCFFFRPEHVDMYLINKHAPLGWFAVHREHVQVGGGGEARLHHGNKGLLGDTCDLRTRGKCQSNLPTLAS